MKWNVKNGLRCNATNQRCTKIIHINCSRWGSITKINEVKTTSLSIFFVSLDHNFLWYFPGYFNSKKIKINKKGSIKIHSPTWKNLSYHINFLQTLLVPWRNITSWFAEGFFRRKNSYLRLWVKFIHVFSHNLDGNSNLGRTLSFK